MTVKTIIQQSISTLLAAIVLVFRENRACRESAGHKVSKDCTENAGHKASKDCRESAERKEMPPLYPWAPWLRFGMSMDVPPTWGGGILAKEPGDSS